MSTNLTREELDQWLQETAKRLKPHARTTPEGEIAELVAGEVEVIEPQVATADLPYFHDQVRDIIEALACVQASHPDE